MTTAPTIPRKPGYLTVAKPRYALLGSGAVSRSLLGRFPGLTQEVGPVAASSIRVASRIANSMNCGFAVRDIASFDPVMVILVCAPKGGLPRLMGMLGQAPLEWKRTTILLVDSGGFSRDYPHFQQWGASVGSLNPVDGLVGSFVLEGARGALREARRMVKQMRGHAVEVRYDQIFTFHAARTAASSLFTPLIDNCVEALQVAGLDRIRAAQFAEALFARSLRSYMRAGRRGWSGPVASGNRAAVLDQYEAFRKVDARRAEYFRESADLAFQLYETFPELFRNRSKVRKAL